MVVDIALIAQLIAAGGIGGIVVNWFSGRADRRAARARFLKNLNAMTGGNSASKYVLEAFRAHLPRGLAQEYVEAYQDAHEAAAHAGRFDEQPHDITASPEDRAQTIRVANAAAHYVRSLREVQEAYAWNPMLYRIIWRAHLVAARRSRNRAMR